MQEKIKIGYDPIYNYYPTHHGEIIRSTQNDFEWKSIPGMVQNHYEESLLSDSADERVRFISGGTLAADACDWVFSPHILPLNPEQNNKVAMEIEAIGWLFGDTYEEVSQPVPQWKIDIFCRAIMNPSLVKICWQSQSAYAQFTEFQVIYKLPTDVTEKIMSISSVLLPGSAITEKKTPDTSGNHLLATCTTDNFFRKGGDVLVTLVELLTKLNVPPWSLSIVGSMPNEFIKRISADNVHIYQSTDFKGFQKRLDSADVFLFPSRADSFGLTAMEAMNHGLYVLSTSGKAVLATKEFLSDYPNHQIIESKGHDGTYDILDEQLFCTAVISLLQNPIKLQSFDSPCNLARLRKDVLSVFSS